MLKPDWYYCGKCKRIYVEVHDFGVKEHIIKVM